MGPFAYWAETYTSVVLRSQNNVARVFPPPLQRMGQPTLAWGHSLSIRIKLPNALGMVAVRRPPVKHGGPVDSRPQVIVVGDGRSRLLKIDHP